jgi:hypothetical protein
VLEAIDDLDILYKISSNKAYQLVKTVFFKRWRDPKGNIFSVRKKTVSTKIPL